MTDNTPSYDMQRLADECETAVNDFHNEYDRIVSSENERRKEEAAVQNGGFEPSDDITSDEGKARMKAAASACRNSVQEAYEYRSRAVLGNLAAAPDEEAVRTLQTLQLRKEVSPTEVEAIKKTYGGKSHQFDKALDELAREKCKGYKSLFSERTPIETEADKMKDLSDRVSRHVGNVTFPGKHDLTRKTQKALILESIENAREGKSMSPFERN